MISIACGVRNWALRKNKVYAVVANRFSGSETFLARCERSVKLIREIISGKSPIEPKTALQFEKVLVVDADI